MIVGLISDTHGDAKRTVRAARVFAKAKVHAVLHAGDVGSQAVVNELLALDAPLHAVLGNTDYEIDLPPFVDVTLGGKRFAVAHGHDAARLQNAIRCGFFDYVITGHTHERRDEKIGNTRVINPGAIYRANPPSFAILDLSTGRLEFHALTP